MTIYTANILSFPDLIRKASSAKKPTALVIDDNPLIRTSERLLLRYDGFEVFTAPDGKTALEVFKNNRDDIDVVITDYQLPEMNGSELFHRIHEYATHTPVMLVSSDTFKVDAKTLDEFDAVLTIPFNGQDFITIARELACDSSGE